MDAKKKTAALVDKLDKKVPQTPAAKRLVSMLYPGDDAASSESAPERGPLDLLESETAESYSTRLQRLGTL